uniref:RING-type E3 ubiquitin transferase n=1 Tax=Chlorocebus sabaeus TaxID=60711 RepID=A0A0D9S0S6_CHLSB
MASAITQCSTSELTCSICTDYLTDPVTICCGHRFCNPCLCLLWEDALTPNCCPVCKEISQQMYFKRIIFAEKQAIPTGESVSCQLSSSAMLICGRHQEIKNLICETDRSLLCFLCSQSPRHANHKHFMTKEADEYYRNKLLIQMKSIWKKKQKNQRNLNRETNIIRTWKVFIHLRSMMISAEYPKVCQYLREEEQKHLEGLAREGRIVFEQLKISQTRMAKMSVLLRGMFEKLKEMSCKADVNLPQDLGDIMKRNEFLRLAMPQPVNPQLSAWTITGMSERLNFFRVYITMDHKICSNHKLLFEDLRHLQCSLDDTDMSCTPTSTQYTSSWGAQILTSGKHYWEVDVKDSCNWVIGLCREAWTKRNDMRLDSEGIFLLLCLKVDDHFSLLSTSPLLPHYIPRPQGWLGVFLDYECGIVSFVNVAQSSLICSFLSCIFYFPLRPFICHGSK